MRPSETVSKSEADLFPSRLDQVINRRHGLVQLAGLIDWKFFDQQFESLYSETGRPGISAARQQLIAQAMADQAGRKTARSVKPDGRVPAVSVSSGCSRLKSTRQNAQSLSDPHRRWRRSQRDKIAVTLC